MMEALERMLTGQRLTEMNDLRNRLNANIRKVNMAMCTATNPEYPMDQRIAAFNQAVSLCERDSFRLNELKRQCPEFADLINESESA